MFRERVVFVVCLCVLTYAVCAPSAHAQTAGWNPIGPERGTAFAIAVDPQNPSTLYAGTKSGVFKSSDGGSEWSPTNAGLPTQEAFPENGGPYIYALAVHPQNGSTIYAGVTYLNFFAEPSGRGVFASTDGGASWHAANGGIESLAVYSLAVDRQTPTTLYLVGRIGTADMHAYKSTDGGSSWSLVSTVNVFSLVVAIDPLVSGTVYVGTVGGVFKTTDDGATWTAMNGGLNTFIDALAIDPTNSATVYAGTRGGGVFKSTDGGSSWTAVNNGLTSLQVKALTIDPQSTTLYAGTRAGEIFKSTDGGTSWSAIDTGVTAPMIHSLAVHPQAATTVYVGTDRNGIFKSENAGAQWSLTSLRNVRVFSLAAHPSASGSLFVGDDWSRVYHGSDESGWLFAPDLNPSTPVSGLAVDPTTPANVFAATSRGLYKSANGGSSFTLAQSVQALAVAIDPVVPSTIYAGGAGAFKSVDGGSTWTQIVNGLAGTGRLTSLAIDPQNPTTVYAATQQGVYKTVNGGSNWTPANGGVVGAVSLAVDPQNPSTVYTGTGSGVFKSVDGGANWTASSNGLPASQVSALAIDPDVPSHVFAGTFGAGVFESDDGGASWTALNDQLPNLFVKALTTDSTSTLYAGTDGAGVFAIDAPAQFGLSVDMIGRGGATIASTDGGISCGADCTEAYDAGTTITLTATANSGDIKGWIGCDTDTGKGKTSSCIVTMNAARNVSVNLGGRAKTAAHVAILRRRN